MLRTNCERRKKVDVGSLFRGLHSVQKMMNSVSLFPSKPPTILYIKKKISFLAALVYNYFLAVRKPLLHTVALSRKLRPILLAGRHTWA